MSSIDYALEQWGLTAKEIKTYLSLLELGESTTLRLSEITKINRTTLYDVLDILIKKGLVGSTIKEKVKYFYTSKPQALLSILKEKETAIRDVIPLLIKRAGSISSRPKIEFFEGARGIDAIHQDVLNNAKEIFAYGSYAITAKEIAYQSLDFRKKRITLKIPITVITDGSAKEIELLQQKKYKKLTKIYINETLSQMPVWNYIYGNKVATLSFEKEQFFGFIIESKALVAKELFIIHTLLKQAKP